MHRYRKYIKKGIVLSCLLLAFCTSVPFVYATESSQEEEAESKVDQEEIDRLENERQETIDAIEGLKDSISDVQKDIDSLKNEKGNIQSYINKLDKQINSLTKEIEEFEGKIEEKIVNIEETQEALEEAKIACEEQYESMKMRIQFIYENPSESLIEMICSSKNIAEFLNRADHVASMSEYDRNMMDKMIETKKEIEVKEITLEAELEELEMMQKELKSQKEKVNASINSKKGELAATTTAIGNASMTQDEYEKQLEEQEKLLNQIEEQIAKAANPDAYKGSVTGFIWPCPGYTRISSYFGPRPQPTAGASTNHKGVDLAAPYGSSILASASGVVTTATYSNSAGNYIVIAHGNGISTVYMHCSSRLVGVGETVEQGEVIAKVGSTGYSTGNHLHFGVIKNGSYVDPMAYISP